METKYVIKSDVKPHIARFERWISEIRENIRREGITFTHGLVGSAKRNMVIKHHNKGFDCDFQIIISKNHKNLSEEGIKTLFRTEFNAISTKEGFDHGENSTSSITMKLINVEKSKIEVSYDVVILSKNGDTTEILRYCKENEEYRFEPLPDFTDFTKRYKQIKGNNMWIELRKRYYCKKINEKDGKKSFQLLNEAVNEILYEFK